MLSEEEIINKIYKLRNALTILNDYGKEDVEAIDGLLDLYNKEKEDVIKQYELGLTQGAYEKNLVWEDKIREKMKEVEHLSTAGYEILKELLGKE